MKYDGLEDLCCCIMEVNLDLVLPEGAWLNFPAFLRWRINLGYVRAVQMRCAHVS